MKRPVCGFKTLTGPMGLRNERPYYIKARWDGCAPRPPKKGELFISGAIPAAYRAYEDMTQPYFIAVPLDPETYLPKGD